MENHAGFYYQLGNRSFLKGTTFQRGKEEEKKKKVSQNDNMIGKRIQREENSNKTKTGLHEFTVCDRLH